MAGLPATGRDGGINLIARTPTLASGPPRPIRRAPQDRRSIDRSRTARRAMASRRASGRRAIAGTAVIGAAGTVTGTRAATAPGPHRAGPPEFRRIPAPILVARPGRAART